MDVRTIALAPFEMSADVGDRERLTAEIERAATEVLVRQGFRVVPMQASRDLWSQIASEVGPVYDGKTGAVDPDRWKTVGELVDGALAHVHGAEATLQLRVERVEVHLVARTLQYCGVEDPIYWPVGEMKATATLVRGACLVAALYDRDRRLLHQSGYGMGLYETYARQTRALLPVEERFRDSDRIRDAIDAALGPLRPVAGPDPPSVRTPSGSVPSPPRPSRGS